MRALAITSSARSVLPSHHLSPAEPLGHHSGSGQDVTVILHNNNLKIGHQINTEDIRCHHSDGRYDWHCYKKTPVWELWCSWSNLNRFDPIIFPTETDPPSTPFHQIITSLGINTSAAIRQPDFGHFKSLAKKGTVSIWTWQSSNLSPLLSALTQSPEQRKDWD